MAILHINIVTLNNLNYLKDCINSIKTKHKYKLRIIDQESSDGTQDWCREQGIDCHRFQPRVSLSEAWNYGFREAIKDEHCEYIFFPNNDVIFHPTTIDNLVYAMKKFNYAMVTGSNVAHDMSLQDMKDKLEMGDSNFDGLPISNWREEGPDFSCPLITKQTLEKVGYFDENFIPAYFEDNDYHLRILKAGLHAKRITKSPYYHFGSMTIRTNPNLGISASRTERVFIEKWGAMPADCMDGRGHGVPYNDISKNYKYWRGFEKYEL